MQCVMNAQVAFNQNFQTVMFVDNDDDLRTLVTLLFDNRGLNVLTASGGQEALDLMSSGGPIPDLIITDMNMMGMDGSELCSKLKQNVNTQQVPVVLISGIEDIEEAATLMGANGYLQKPYQLEKLTELVNNYLS
jgi:two-component system, OmpR family, response regulator VicR